MNKQMVTIFGYPRACRFRKHQFENRSWLLPLPTFFKKWFNSENIAKIGQNWSKLVIIDRFSNFFGLFSRFSGRGTHQRRSYNEYSQKWDFFEKIKKIYFLSFFANFSHILWSKITIWKKLEEVGAMTYFQIDVFGIYMLWGIQK
jgi:hypothetical protein